MSCFPAMHNGISASDIRCHERMSCFWLSKFFQPLECFFFSQNQLSAKFRALRHEHLVATRAKPKPDLRSQRWICIFSKPCAKRMNVTQKRYEPPPSCIDITVTIQTYFFQGAHTVCPFLCVFGLICPLIVFAGKECISDQFHGFPGLTGSFKSSRFSSGSGGDCHNTCSTVWLHCHALHLLFPFVIFSFLLLPLLNV